MAAARINIFFSLASTRSEAKVVTVMGNRGTRVSDSTNLSLAKTPSLLLLQHLRQLAHPEPHRKIA